MNKTIKEKWEKGKGNTLHFYTKKIFYKTKQFNHKFIMPDYFDRMIGNKSEVSIADLGAGLFSTTGCLWNTAKINLYPSDDLANEYRQILKQFKIKPLIPIEKQNMEHLSYSNELFDIVHCTNALDHCVDPLKALREMYRICKFDGWIYLRHFSNSGVSNKYSGLHLWNISIVKNNDCLIWNNSHEFLLSDHFKGFNTVEKRELYYEPDNMIVSILRKK